MEKNRKAAKDAQFVEQPETAEQARLAAKMPARAKLLATVERIRPEDRARAGITQEMIERSQQENTKKGIEVVRGPWAANAGADVEDQVRVLDHDNNVVLFSGSAAEYKRLQRAVGADKEE